MSMRIEFEGDTCKIYGLSPAAIGAAPASVSADYQQLIAVLAERVTAVENRPALKTSYTLQLLPES